MNPEVIRQALQRAHEDGKITCDRLELYESYSVLPDQIKASVTLRMYVDERYVIAWRRDGWAFVSLPKQLTERAPIEMVASVACEDLAAELDRIEAARMLPVTRVDRHMS